MAKASARGTKHKSAAKSAKPRSSKAKSSAAKPSKARPSKAKPSKAKPAAAKSSKAKPAKAKPAKAKPAKAAATGAAESTSEAIEVERQRLLEETSKIRDSVWSAWGSLESDVIAHAINPTFMGGPRWPAMRQAYRVAHHGEDVLLASDGLADPYDPDEGPQDVNGVEVEMFAITDDDIARPVDGVVKYGATWLHDLVFHCAHLAADHGGLAALIDELGAISTELHDVKIPEEHRARYFNEHGRVGVLLSRAHAPIPAEIMGPLSPIRLVHVQLLRLEELAFVLAGGEEARTELLNKLIAQGVYPRSRIDRPSAV